MILSNDVLMVARASIGILTLTEEQKKRADVVASSSSTPDGLILSNDLLIIARASLGMVTPLCNEALKSGTVIQTVCSSYPSISISSPADQSTVSQSTVTVSGTASPKSGTSCPALSQIECKVGSGSYQTCSGTSSWTCSSMTLSGGSNTITCRVADTTGSSWSTTAAVTYSGGGSSDNPWITIPAGDFIMGCATGDTECYSNETPKHTVTLSAYKIQKYEVTNAQYKQCVDAGNCTAPYDSSSYIRSSYYGNLTYNNYPVIYVDWNQSKAYCQWIGGRLPTEAEWEKAARGPSPREVIYPWGDTISSNYANYWNSGDPYDNDTTPVGYYDGSLQGSYQTQNGASYYGVMDMAGNVWEWVNDWYDETYYSSSPSSNPQGAPSGNSRAMRGGSWGNGTRLMRASCRHWDGGPSYWLYFLGFRCSQDF